MNEFNLVKRANNLGTSITFEICINNFCYNQSWLTIFAHTYGGRRV